jgi:nucleoside 2-deoxyribosyltransferase
MKFVTKGMKTKPAVYVAAPLFSQAELDFNRQIKQALSHSFRVFLPQEDGDLMNDLLRCGLSAREAVQKVFAQDVVAVRNCDAILIVMDGRSIDEGAAFELGVAYALRKVCVGVQTDVRRLAAFGNNPMIEGPCERIFSRIEDAVFWLEHRFAERITTPSVTD